MSVILLDTSVLSELIHVRPERRVVDFVKHQPSSLISALTLHELIHGAERAPDPRRRAKLSAWVAALRAEFQDRIVTVDAAIAEHGGRIRAAAAGNGAVVTPMDALIAACAASRGAAVATRNVRDFAALGVTVIDPWSA